MNLKDLFDKAENGTLTYEQFTAFAAAAGAKFADLSEGAYVAKQKYTDDLAARDTRITTLNDTLTQRDTDLTALKNQLAAAGTDTEKLNQLNTDFAELQKKYDKDTKAYQKQLKDQDRKFAANKFADTLQFTSKAAKQAFVTALMGKNLEVEGETMLGATDFLTSYKEDNADSFKVEDATPAPAEPKPQFVSPTTPASAGTADVNPISFQFVGVRPHDNK